MDKTVYISSLVLHSWYVDIFHLASIQSSQVDPAAGLQFSKSLSTSELSLVESSEAAMKVRVLSFFSFDSLGLYWITKLCFLFIHKETGTSLQTLTPAATMERLIGNNTPQPSLSTRDALDKYHIVTQKVSTIAIMFFENQFWGLYIACGWLL